MNSAIGRATAARQAVLKADPEIVAAIAREITGDDGRGVVSIGKRGSVHIRRPNGEGRSLANTEIMSLAEIMRERE